MDVDVDVLGLLKSMEEAGFSRPQAELLSALQAALVNGHLATKVDIEALRSATKADIEALRSATKADIEALRLSTKADIDALRLSTKSDIALLKSDIEALRALMEFRFTAAAELTRRDLETMQNRMTVRLGSIVIASVVTGSAVVALLGRFLGAHP